jgi:hypothetical protein
LILHSVFVNIDQKKVIDLTHIIKLRTYEDGKIKTVYNPYIKHYWYYNGLSPTLEDHKMIKDYLKGRFKRKVI